jgi:hypothetical protein
LRIKPQSVDDFNEALRSSAASLNDMVDPVALSVVMRGIGGREKPWGPILRQLQAGEYPYALGRQGCIVREIFVDGSDVSAIRNSVFQAADWPEFPFSHIIHQIDACDILNVSVRNRHVIEKHKIGNHRRGLLFNRAAVAELAAKIVTSAELRARHFMDTFPTIARIRRGNLQPRGFGFDRATGIDKFDDTPIR